MPVINIRQKLNVKTEQEWKASDPVLLKNEAAYSKDKNFRFKVGDGTSKWSELSYSGFILGAGLSVSGNEVYIQNASASNAGLMSSFDKVKLNTVEEGANNYVHPSYLERVEGLYKVTVDEEGHVSSASTVQKSDITALGIPAQDTTYEVASSSKSGLLSASDKAKLDTIANGANNYTHPSYTQRSSGLYKITVDESGHVSDVAAVSKADITNLGIPAQDTTYNVASSSANGLMSAADKSKLDGIASGANKYIHPSYDAQDSGLYKITVDESGHVSEVTPVTKSDITALGIPSSDTNTWTAFKGASSSDAGTAGYVPAPSAGAANRYFRSDGTWAVPPDTNTTYTLSSFGITATASELNYMDGVTSNVQTQLNAKAPSSHFHNSASGNSAGFMSAADKSKLDGIANGANNYTHPSYDAQESGLYKITVDATGHVSEVSPVGKSDITALGIPSTNTTYSAATTSTAGLMSAADKTKLDGIASGANKYTHPSYTQRSSGLYKITVDATGHVSEVTAVTKSDITALGIPSSDTNTWTAFKGASSSAAGTAGYVPAPSAGASNRYFRSDGTWAVPPDTNTTYSTATTSTNGLMSATDKSKLDGIASGANKYIHPSYDAQDSGLYKITVDATGHVSEVVAVSKSDITALGIPSTNTTYSAATTSTAGLMSAADKSKLDGIASGANKYTHPSYTQRSSGLYKITVDATGHVSEVTAVSKSDITALGIPSSDTNTWTAFKGASSSAAGTAGYVPAPSAGASNRYFRSDGTWAVPPDTNTTYSTATTSANGLMSASDKSKLDGIASGANKYTHPSYTQRSSGLYKITVDGSGHVSAATAVSKSDITALGIPSTNTTYSAATTSTAGLMSAADKTKLDGINSSAVNVQYSTTQPTNQSINDYWIKLE